MQGASVLALDLGEYSTKCGFAGANVPHSVFPTCISRPNEELIHFDDKEEIRKRTRVGECALWSPRRPLGNAEAYPLRHPASAGALDILLEHAIEHELGISQEEKQSTRLALTTKRFHHWSPQVLPSVLFETHQLSQVTLLHWANAALYSQGYLTGVACDLGHKDTQIQAVYESFVMHHLHSRVCIGGLDINGLLLKMLLLRGYAVNWRSRRDRLLIDDIKKMSCFVSANRLLDERLARDTTTLLKTYTLPDGRTLALERERFACTESLFRPDMCDVSSAGFGTQLYYTIQRADISLRYELFKHIFLFGGTSLFPGLATRVETEIKELYCLCVLKGNREQLQKFRCGITHPPRAEYTCWLGLSIFACITKEKESAQGQWLSKEQYEEDPDGVAKKMLNMLRHNY